MEADEPVLVALVSRPRDMELVRTEHWYRIPARHAPRFFTQACYVAFYLTRAFGNEKWSIREYAPVRGHELVRRRDLFPGEASHPRADELYYMLQLGMLIPLPRPIVSRSGRRILFIWTSGARFSEAVEINDLLGKSPADDALWQALKRSGIPAERQVVVRDYRARYRVDYWISCVSGDLVVFLGDVPERQPKGRRWQSLCFSDEDALDKTDECIASISRRVCELGDIQYPSELTT